MCGAEICIWMDWWVDEWTLVISNSNYVNSRKRYQKASPLQQAVLVKLMLHTCLKHSPRLGIYHSNYYYLLLFLCWVLIHVLHMNWYAFQYWCAFILWYAFPKSHAFFFLSQSETKTGHWHVHYTRPISACCFCFLHDPSAQVCNGTTHKKGASMKQSESYLLEHNATCLHQFLSKVVLLFSGLTAIHNWVKVNPVSHKKNVSLLSCRALLKSRLLNTFWPKIWPWLVTCGIIRCRDVKISK